MNKGGDRGAALSDRPAFIAAIWAPALLSPPPPPPVSIDVILRGHAFFVSTSVVAPEMEGIKLVLDARRGLGTLKPQTMILRVSKCQQSINKNHVCGGRRSMELPISRCSQGTCFVQSRGGSTIGMREGLKGHPGATAIWLHALFDGNWQGLRWAPLLHTAGVACTNP